MNQEDLDKYTGPLTLWCLKCDKERATILKFGDVKVAPGEKSKEPFAFDITATGRRVCAWCESDDLVLFNWNVLLEDA